MKSSVFSYDDYKTFLRARIKEESKNRGFQGRMATAAGCHPSFLSQALNSHIQLTLDHASGISQFLGLAKDEEEFFYCLLERERAVNLRLIQYFQNKLDEIKKKQSVLSYRLEHEKIADETIQSSYYSSWIFAALHILVSIPDYQTIESIKERMPDIPLKLIEQTLSKLKKFELIEYSNGKWRIGKRHIHLTSESHHIGAHHTNWKQRAVLSANIKSEENIHYSVIQALSHNDILKIKMLILQFIDQNKKIVSPSTEEELYCLNIDWFKV